MSYLKRDISKKRKFVADGVFYSELNEVSNLLIQWVFAEINCPCPSRWGDA